MRRRDLLWTAAASAGALLPPLAWAGWGAAPSATTRDLLLPAGVRAERVLEVFLYGGLGPFESFYVVEENGRADDPRYPSEQFHLFADAHAAVFGGCGLEAPWLQPFGRDGLGQAVSLGPLTAPLWARPDILARLRILVHRHALEPHEAAIPYALSGHRLGATRLAGLGAAVQRHCLEHDTTGRRVPYSYVLYPSTEISTDNLRAASAVGLHPGAARPFNLRISEQITLQRALMRANVGSHREAYDALLAHYAQDAALRYGRAASLARADHQWAQEALAGADALREVFDDLALSPEEGQACGASGFSSVATSLKLAAHLLTHPSAPARHITVVDGGLVPASGGGGYDVHTLHLPDTARNLTHTLATLADHIRRPGTSDPELIDLDETMIVLNTEFGRTPFRQVAGSDGTNHHPYGYVTVLIGGPATAGVLGGIGPDGLASRYLTPTESRAAVLAAMGIYPFSNASFAVGDLRELSDERDGLAWLNEVVLGVPR